MQTLKTCTILWIRPGTCVLSCYNGKLRSSVIMFSLVRPRSVLHVSTVDSTSLIRQTNHTFLVFSSLLNLQLRGTVGRCLLVMHFVIIVVLSFSTLKFGLVPEFLTSERTNSCLYHYLLNVIVLFLLN